MGLRRACGDLKAGPLNSGLLFQFPQSAKGQHLVGLMLRVDYFIWLYGVWTGSEGCNVSIS